MPIPVQSDVHVNRPLTNLVESYAQDMKDFVSMTVFPPVSVDERSNLFYSWDRADFNRPAVKPRAPGTRAEASGVRLATKTYACIDYALAHPVPDAIRGNADPMVNLDYSGTRYLTNQALTDREINWATKYFGPGLWATTMTGNATADSTHVKFWDAAGSSPIEDIFIGKETIKMATGMDANVLVLSYQVKRALKRNPELIDLLKYGQTAPGPVVIKDSDLAALFEVDRVVTMGAIKTTSAEGAATATSAFIGGKHAMLAYAAPAPGIDVASAGYTFNWRNAFNGNAAPGGWRIKKYRDETIESDVLEMGQSYDQNLVAVDLGYFFASVVQ